jgi:hypothetical protein
VTPFFPPLFEFREYRLEIPSDIVVAPHSVRESHAPNAPPVWFQRADLLEIEFVRDFPNQSSAAIVWRDDKGVPVEGGCGVKICDFAKRESVSGNVIKNLKTMIDGGPWRSCNESRLNLRGTRGIVVNCKWLSDWGRGFLFLLIHRAHASTAPLLSAAMTAGGYQEKTLFSWPERVLPSSPTAHGARVQLCSFAKTRIGEVQNEQASVPERSAKQSQRLATPSI